jgi:dihydropteroate synthase
MGVLNVTPDSFSDGGRYVTRDDAIAHARLMCAAGADVVDVGGESTRPGAARVDVDTEISRVVPVIRDLTAADVPVSIDTTRADVAMAALDAGAVIVNDVSGGLADPAMAKVVAEAGCPWILMHWRGHSRDMNRLAVYTDVVAEVCAELRDRAQLAAVRAPGRADGDRVPSTVRLQPQVLPGPAVGRRGRHAAPGRPAGGGHAGHHAAGGGRRRLGSPGARRRRHPRRDPRLADHQGVPMSTEKMSTENAKSAHNMGTDRITLTGLRARGRHGVYDFEREQGQDFLVDVELTVDLAPVAASDDVADTVHYGELADRLVEVVTGPPVHLIETLADRLAAVCLADPRVLAAVVTVHKPQAPIAHPFTDVAVTVRRERSR